MSARPRHALHCSTEGLDLRLESLDLSLLRLRCRKEHTRVAIEIDHVPVAVDRWNVGTVFDDEPQMTAPGVRRCLVLVGREPESQCLRGRRSHFVERQVTDVFLHPTRGGRTTQYLPGRPGSV